MENTNVYRPMLPTNRGLAKWILLGIITIGIYPLVIKTRIGKELNRVAAIDGKNTMHYCLIFFLLGPLTLGIMALIWFHLLSERIGNELRRRQIAYSFSAGTFWGWGFFGSLLLGIGPLIYIHKLCRASNMLNIDYNFKG